MSNKKKFSIFSFLICVLTTIFVFSLNKTFAETPEVSVTGKFADTITVVNVTSNEGGNLNWDLEQWATFRINATYDLAGKNVKAGDQTTVTVPDALIITSDSFEIRDINTNEIIAHATVDAENKKLTLTYTDYVEKHSDTNGSFFFYARIDFKKHPQQGEIPIEVTVNSVTKVAGKVTFKGIGDGNPRLLTKTSWVNSGNHKEVQYTISVNRNKQNIKGVTIEDHLRFTNASYVKDSIKVIKGKFSYETGEWVFSDRVDVTDQHKITISEDGQSFVIDLGDITDQDQYRIDYKVQLNYEPVDGELLKNEATLKGKEIESKDVTNIAAVQVAGGSGVGYVFTINVHKVDDANQPIKGAKFKVVREANNQVIGEYETDENGNITVNALLKDKYILTETEAPAGFVIKDADTVVNVEDFGTDHAVTKTIVNPKEETTTTTTTTSTTTTTEAPTTSTTTTTEAPTTSTTTTEAPTTSTTTTEAPTTSTTTTEAPTTSTTTTEAPTTSTTTTEAPTTSTTTTEAPTTSTTTTEAPTTSTTTTEAPITSTTTTTPEVPTPSSSSETTTTSTAPSVSSETTTTEEKPGLPNTGESKGTLFTIIGAVTLISSIVLVAILHKSKKD
ncbi:Cna protein B-type domain protein [Streptococcus infantis SK1076]|uniref:Cna protein B-type domain protein n=1 Tax=Streptococcus infantis SK1076 TaxID=1005705 RepID=F5W0M9_9STRE|nr:LPXTG cell wall anchor domain-containing protein [Streptococcus infantis]EGL86290.1 Cna protein B-type domain protein [Streptococcus infantis SK1076]